MSNDAGKPLSDAPKPDFTLPGILDIQIRAIQFEAPRHRNFSSALPSGEAVEFIVRTDGPIPSRALGPALFVGDAVVTEVSPISPNTYRFIAMGGKDLKQDAPIHLGWTGQRPPKSKDAAFRYRL